GLVKLRSSSVDFGPTGRRTFPVLHGGKKREEHEKVKRKAELLNPTVKKDFGGESQTHKGDMIASNAREQK
ncbi:MAG: hypothetical protein ACLPY5_07725, partial [Candidatus Bathyarchaeia archaeon]